MVLVGLERHDTDQPHADEGFAVAVVACRRSHEQRSSIIQVGGHALRTDMINATEDS